MIKLELYNKILYTFPGKSEVTVKQEKPAVPQKSNVAKDKGSAAGKQKVKIVEPNKEENPEDDDESSDGDLMSEDDDDDSKVC